MKRVKRQRICFDKKGSIENLSNEIFYEIFDYLDGYDIYQSFSNLNNRFTDLLMDCSYVLKFQLTPSTIFDYHEWICLNQHRILSLHFPTERYINTTHTLNYLNASFIRLESLIINEVFLSKLHKYFSNLKILPQLNSLSIYFANDDDDIGEIYEIIFSLSKLKNFRLKKLDDPEICMIIPISSNGNFSNLKFLSIHHVCPIDELINLLSYTPHLSHLYCPNIHESDAIDDDMKSQQAIQLNHLKYLIIVYIWIRSFDKSYLDSNRWENLITNKMKHLKAFNLAYNEFLDDEFEINSAHVLLHRFNSSFWFNRKWCLNIEIEQNDIMYFISPQSKSWIDYQEYIEDETSTNYCFPKNTLYISDAFITYKSELLFNKIQPLFDLISINSLDINCDHMYSIILIKLLNSLSNLRYLRMSEHILFSRQDKKLFKKLLKTNKIRKITLANTGDVVEAMDILRIFPRLQYFAIQKISTIDIQLFTGCLLLEIRESQIKHLRTICFFGIDLEEFLLEELQNIIDFSSDNCQVYRQNQRFYLQFT